MPEKTVFERIEEFLHARGVAWEVMRHEPVFTSAEAAAVRGTSLASGAKALIVKVDDTLELYVMPADRKLASKKVRAARHVRRVRFATAEEVLERTGLRPGSIPPFGSLIGFETICDPKLGEHETINFNAGDHTVSISMRYADYLAAEGPTIAEITQ